MAVMAKFKKRKRKKNKRRLNQRVKVPAARLSADRPSEIVQQAPSRADWTGPDGVVGAYIAKESKKTLEAYRIQADRIAEDANLEEDTARGGYAHRQLFELIQNGADALSGSSGGRVFVELTPTNLYCADNGRPIDSDGMKALMFSRLSPKRGTNEIGRFGLGFKSVLGVSDTPEFFSHSGSFRFDRERAARLLQPIAPNLGRYPVLRLPEAIDPWTSMKADPTLGDLMSWATNIVRLPLKVEAHADLGKQIDEFPAEFLLFVEHVKRLVLKSHEQETAREITMSHIDGLRVLDNGGVRTRWALFEDTHRLSQDARSDSRSLDEASEVPISWAVPVDSQNEAGKFWAFFPTKTTSLLSGILNAPWKTNEDRQNLLPGFYNNELIDAAAAMVATALPGLSTERDPARHLDALPRRHYGGDSEHSDRLREQLNLRLNDQAIAPDQFGELRSLVEMSYPPRHSYPAQEMNPEALERWAAYDGRPSGWLHHSALARRGATRMATLDRLFESDDASLSSSLPRASISEWLEALLSDEPSQPPTALQLDESAAAIQTASLIPEDVRKTSNLGKIVITANGQRVEPDPGKVFLGGGHASGAGHLVHPGLEEDPETLRALKALGLKPASAETTFKDYAKNTFTDQGRANWNEFWRRSREIDYSKAAPIIENSDRDWRTELKVRTLDGQWRTLFRSLLPGPIVPGDGSRDSNVAIDVNFHEPDLPVLRQLGAVNTPRNGHELSRVMTRRFTADKREKFTQQELPSNPRLDMLNFDTTTTSGPLDVLELLSDEGKALYTCRLLDLPDTYERWTMRHNTRRDVYRSMKFESPALEALRKHGHIKTDGGVYPLSDGIGKSPQNREVLYKLLDHPRVEQIRESFDLADPSEIPAEPVGEDLPVPLVDEWPGLRPHLSPPQNELQLIRCDGFRRFDGTGDEGEPGCEVRDGLIYLARQDDEEYEIRAVLEEFGMRLSDDQLNLILLGLTSEDVQNARDEVRGCSTDEERLIAAIGLGELGSRLPSGLFLMLFNELGASLTGIELARAAISVFHTGALREYRHALDHLDPPRQWAGSQRAVAFVRSLGFSEEWAGERNSRRDPYVDVDGPYSLPKLHDYQRRVVENVRGLIHSNGEFGERRGMVSMPTGSGKTRVAVQSIVEAIRDDGFKGGILWVADRDELCEQAVEAWRQVWSSEGAQGVRLRISRMWAGQRQPSLTGDINVIVATIQTLSAKISRQPDSYQFLAEFKLLLFDEAHRSVAPTFTSVMEDLGLTRWRRTHEPLLIGLTATPYRGHDERETTRLVRRYSSNRLDEGAFASDDPEAVIQELQSMRVLARADHSIIEGGDFPLSANEQRQSQQTPWLPRSVENRIASDVTRTRRIIQAYHENVDPDWPTLVFATSVEHSQTVAALLTRIGIKARAVSADTETSVRRRVVEEFRSGEIKALVNYGIFREGFDAPKTRAIIVARPVYSPNLYFQMIGRGLRGVKNGGNDRCLILNVRDNIENFQRKLAFSELNWLWD